MTWSGRILKLKSLLRGGDKEKWDDDVGIPLLLFRAGWMKLRRNVKLGGTSA